MHSFLRAVLETMARACRAGDGARRFLSGMVLAWAACWTLPALAGVPQVITFANPGAQNFGTTATLTATATSGLAVTFSSATSGVCTLSGSTLFFLSTGSCTINADQAGDSTYDQASTVSRTFPVYAVVPGAPTIGVASAGDTQATITFSPPASNGGSPVTSYTVISNPGGIIGTGAASPIVVNGLTNGVSYTFVVTADNSAGTGSASAATNSVTPNPGPAVVSVAVPADGTYHVGDNLDFTVTWDTNVVVTGTPQLALTIGATTVRANYASSPTSTTTLFRYTVISGQTDNNGITVGALTLNGGTIQTATGIDATLTLNSVASTTNVLVNTSVPGAPTGVSATAGNAQATISFTAPASNGGSAILSYTATASPGGRTGSCNGPSACTITVTGLTNGTAYTFTVVATNVNGSGSSSSPSSSTLYSGPPVAAAASLQAQLNTPATLDLLSYITGTGVTGITITTAPSHGTVTTSGTQVTYTPASNFFGSDYFSYAAVNASGSSSPAQVTVTVAGRPDPTRDANVIALNAALASTARNFWRMQIQNFQQRMEALHRRAPLPEPEYPLSLKPQAPPADANFAQLNARTAFDAQLDGASLLVPPVDPASRLAASLAGVMDARLRAQAMPNGAPPMSDAAMLAALVSSATPGLRLDASGQSAPALQINFAQLSGSGQRSGIAGADDGVWVGGSVRIGSTSSENSDFSTQGVSIGIDRRIDEHLTLGLGVGFAHDKTTVGSDGSNLQTNGSSLVAYGSYQPGAVFFDGLLGYGVLDASSTRYIAAVEDFARASRPGSQLFLSLSTGYGRRHAGLMLSPYARYDQLENRFDQSTEAGAGQHALNYGSQTSSTRQVSLGLRGELLWKTDFGWLMPRGRVEVQHSFTGASQMTLAYADLLTTQYQLATPGKNASAVLIGAGSGAQLSNGLRIDFDYQWLQSNEGLRSQALLMRVSHFWR